MKHSLDKRLLAAVYLTPILVAFALLLIIDNTNNNYGLGRSLVLLGVSSFSPATLPPILIQQREEYYHQYFLSAFSYTPCSFGGMLCLHNECKNFHQYNNAQIRRQQLPLYGLIRRRPPGRQDRNSDEDGGEENYQEERRIQNLPAMKLQSGSEKQVPSFVSLATSSLLYSLDPHSDEAQQICCETLKLTEHQMYQIRTLCDAVVKWNERINLVSRKDCNASTVFGRHVLPSLCTLADSTIHSLFMNQPSVRVIDVGTGGGFPGLPLAIAYPKVCFVLLDSINKKLMAVQDMSDLMGLKNVQVVNQRSESYIPKPKKFNIVTGRSVTALPQFCSWIHANILEAKGGHLVYWIGGDIDPSVEKRLKHKTYVESILSKHNVTSDKQILVLPYKHVRELGMEHSAAVAALDSANPSGLDKKLRFSKRLGPNQRLDSRNEEGGWSVNRQSTASERRSSTSNRSERPNRNSSGRGGDGDSVAIFASKKKLAKGEWRKKSRDLDDSPTYRHQQSSLDSPNSSSSVSNNFNRYKSATSSSPSSSPSE